MEKQQEKIRVCHCNNDVPLIWTFKFVGAEYWCPNCGANYGMLGAGVETELTVKLKKSAKMWRKKVIPYLKGETDEWKYLNK